jgi:hypothetical protein
VISNREWRYVLTLFPALAISASALILFAFDRLQGTWIHSVRVNRKKTAKVAAGLLIVFLSVAVAYSVNDIYYNVRQTDIKIEIAKATDYVLARNASNQSIMLLCPFNYFSQDMVSFYLASRGNVQIKTYQYPTRAVDTYTPVFNITEFVDICRQDNVKYVFTYEYGGTVPYFNTTLNLEQIYIQLYASGNFSGITEEATFGFNPRRILLLTFLG